MGLCNPEIRRRKAFKTIIIPKGIIDPNEDNVIEIPITLDANSSLIVKAPNDPNSCFSVEPYSANFKETAVQAQSTPIPAPPVWHGHGMDFGCQTRGCPIGFTNTQRHAACQFPQTQQIMPEVHSPVCPICARASCKLSSVPYTSRCSYTGPCSLPNVKSELFLRERLDESKLMTRLIDDKIDRILKPLLMTLAGIAPEDDVTRPSSSRASNLYMDPPYRDERFYPRRVDVPEFRSKASDYDSDYPRRRYASVESKASNTVSFNEARRRKSVDYDNDASYEIAKDSSFMCPARASCHKRKQSIDFDDDSKLSDDELSSSRLESSRTDRAYSKNL